MRSPFSVLDGLPAPVRKVLYGIALNATGGGLTLSLFMVYLTTVRGLSAQTVGFVLAWEAVVGLSASGPIGALIDRYGPVRVMLPGILVQAIGVASLSLVTSTAQLMLVATVTSIAGTSIWPAQNTLVAQLTEPEERERAFGLSFMMLNLGFGIGGVLGSLIVRDGDLGRFQWLYRFDGITYLCLAVAVWMVRSQAQSVHAAIERTENPGGYGVVLRDRRVWIMLIGGIVMFTCGYGALNSGVPLFATEYAGLSVRWLGVIFGCNTFCIVALQPFVIRWVQGRSRSVMAALVGFSWAVSWLVLGSSVLFLPVVMLSLAQIVFAFGETLWAPVGPAIVNAMAPDELRGRYNAVFGLLWGVSGMAGPALTGTMFAHGLGNQWWMLMAVGTFVGGFLVLRLRRELDPVTDGRVAESTYD